MTDPWREFAAAAGPGEFVGYFEAPGPARDGPRVAWSYVGAEETFRLAGRADLARIAAAPGPGAPVLGYVGFDAAHLFEPLVAPPRTGPFPLGEFVRPRRLRRSRVPAGRPTLPKVPRGVPLRPSADSLGPRRFAGAVRRLRSRIGEGEAFQVVVSHRRRWPRTDLLRAAGRLRRSERFAYFYYLRFGDREILGASPESVLEVANGWATIAPIAGTRPTSDRGQRRPLAADPKELAEHRMLVDLARNDLGRVARPGSVRVVELERRIRLARLEHLVSRVRGRLRPEIGPWEALGAAFPAGTVSGAPKIRATRLLREEERTWRGPYGGAVGLLEHGGNARWALAIRTAFAAGPWTYTAAGAGIVWGSKPGREWRETLAKLAELESAVVGGGRP